MNDACGRGGVSGDGDGDGGGGGGGALWIWSLITANRSSTITI